MYSTLRRPQIVLIETGQGSPIWAALYAFKARAQATIAQMLPEPYAALLTGILLGVEAGIPRGGIAYKMQYQFVLSFDEILALLSGNSRTG